MNKNFFLLLFVIFIAGCTQQLQSYRVTGVYDTDPATLELDVLATDDMQIRRNTLFSDEMTTLTLNLINLAGVDFTNVRARVLNADDLNPTAEFEYVEVIESNHSERFDWDLTAPSLGVGESLLLNNIFIRTYYDTKSETTKTLLLKEPGDRSYRSTYSSSSESPIALYFDTSYETVTTNENSYKNFTVNLVYFNNYSGVIDYYDNTDITDNYLRNLIIGIDKTLIFNNYYDTDSPWILLTENDDLNKWGLTSNDLLLKNYYYLEFLTLESQGYNVCELSRTNDVETEHLQNMLTQQRRVLWMTKGFTKINVLRLSAPTVTSDTEVTLEARSEYSYSQDYGGDNFGVLVYGLG